MGNLYNLLMQDARFNDALKACHLSGGGILRLRPTPHLRHGAAQERKRYRGAAAVGYDLDMRPVHVV